MSEGSSRRGIGSLDVSLAGLGCANFGMFIDERTAQAVINAALDAGINHFDTADVYGEGLSEEFLGTALGKRRADAIITTKFGAAQTPRNTPPGSASAVRHACEQSLNRLHSDWIDLYLLHQPDPNTPISETLEALYELQRAGKVREVGCSNFGPEQLDEAAEVATQLGMSGFRAVQNSYSLLDRTAESTLAPAATRLGAQLIPYLPLASGLLTGKYRRDASTAATGRLALTLRGQRVSDYFPALLIDECFDIVDELARYASERGHTLVELALAWLASKPFVASVIAGATSPEQVRTNVAATLGWTISEEEQAEIAALTRTDVAYTWNAGFPSYARMPAGVDTTSVPDVRAEV